MKHPIQPLEDDNGIPRFKENKIIRWMLDTGKLDLNDISVLNFSAEDQEQLAQLIGYSLSGFSELSYVTDDTYDAACKMLDDVNQSEDKARIAMLEEKLADLRKHLRRAAEVAFNIHPDDLQE